MHGHASAITQLNENNNYLFQVGVTSTTVYVLDGINPQQMILIGRCPLARRLPLLQVQPTVKEVQVLLDSFFNFLKIIYSLKNQINQSIN